MKYPFLSPFLMLMLLLGAMVHAQGHSAPQEMMGTVAAAATDSAKADTLPLTKADLEAQRQHFAAEAQRLDSLQRATAGSVAYLQRLRDDLHTQAAWTSADTAWLVWMQPDAIDTLLVQPFDNMPVEALEQVRTLALAMGDSELAKRLPTVAFMLEAQGLCAEMRWAISDKSVSRKTCQALKAKIFDLADKMREQHITLTKDQNNKLADLQDSLLNVIDKRR